MVLYGGVGANLQGILTLALTHQGRGDWCPLPNVFLTRNQDPRPQDCLELGFSNSRRLDALYFSLILGRNGTSLSAREARLRVCIHTWPSPLNFITRPSPPAIRERMPPTLPME